MSIFLEIRQFSPNTCKVLFVQWLTSIGYFSVIPFLVVYLVRHQHLSAEFATLQLSLFLVGQYGATFVGGLMTDRISANFTMKCGLTLQITTYLIFLVAEPVHWIICCLSLSIGISKGLFTPAAKALVAKVSVGSNKVLLFSFRSTVNNIGVAIGSSIGGFFMDADSASFFLTAAASQLIALALLFTLKIQPSETTLLNTEGHSGSVGTKQTLIYLSKKPVFLATCILYIAFSFLYMQLESSFPIFASQQWGAMAVSALFIVNAAVVILLQVIVNVWLNKWLSHWWTIGAGFLAFTLCFSGMGIATELWIFVFIIACYTLGEVTIDPTIDAITSEHVPDSLLGTAYGVLGIAGLIGGVVGNSFAGHFLGVNVANPQGLWTLCGIIAVISLVMALLFSQQKGLTDQSEKKIS
ncbi:MFS transporter [Erwinia sp. E602]|uniref:MFS transporter n=1 Tax=Erwinia sp. E602 TaxID=2675378 RepID=UPI001BA61C90|nr:MFS transporter [Erwinia sp. E602]QUG77272.1 MFS transporter [Erwinia sp. E602]